jgi:hypothetical protein
VRRSLRCLPALLVLFCGSTTYAQSISNISPNYGGVGPNAPPLYSFTGTGFSTTPKATRFVDANGIDLFTGVNCPTTSSCTATGMWPSRFGPGGVGFFQVHVMVDNGAPSASSVNFYYYDTLIALQAVPATGLFVGATPYVLSGQTFTSGAAFYPGSTTISLAGSTVTTTGCASQSSCAGTAPDISLACCEAMGARDLTVKTPGGQQTIPFVYGVAPATPAIGTITPSSGPASGGNTVTISGINFMLGTNVSGAPYLTSLGTIFTVVSKVNGASSLATGVNCVNATTCTAVMPAMLPGPVDVQVQTACPTTDPSCGGNPRPGLSVASVSSKVYAVAGIRLTPSTQSHVYTSENGGTATYNVSLASQPSGTVTVSIGVTPGVATASQPFLTFTTQNWAQEQPVTLTGLPVAGIANTSYTVRNIAASMDPNYNGIEGDLAGTNIDKDSKNFVISPPSGLSTTRSGGQASFTVALSQAPSDVVTVSLASNFPAAGTLSAASLTFDTSPSGPTSWSTPRTVTVTGHGDINDLNVHSVPYAIVLTAASNDSAYRNTSTTLFDVQMTNAAVPTVLFGILLRRAAHGAVSASWSNPIDADYFRIKYSTTPGGAKTMIAATTMTSATFTGLAFDTQYYVVVSAVRNGVEGPDSAEASFKMTSPGAVNGYDGDLKSDMAYVTSGGTWHVLDSTSGFTSSTTVTVGGPGLVPIHGDVDGDQRQDVGTYNPSTGAWQWKTSSSGYSATINQTAGGPGYVAVPGDYDGDGRTDPAAYRLSDGLWHIVPSANVATPLDIFWGGPGYTPLPGLDFDGDFVSDIAVYQQSTGKWFILLSSTNFTTSMTVSWGGVGYTLVPGDYDGDGKADFGLYQRSTGAWQVLLSGAGYTTTINKAWGGSGYEPVPGDYDGDRRIDLGVFEQATGNWYALLSTTSYTSTLSVSAWGTNADRPMSAAIFVGGDEAQRASDFDGDGKADLDVYNTTSGAWSTVSSWSSFATASSYNWGGTGYTAVPGDYDGDGRADLGVYQQSTGTWTVLLSSTAFTSALTKSAGGTGWIPAPGDYDGDGRTDFVAYNTISGQWFGLKSSTGYTTTISIGYGGTGYTAVPADFDGDGKTDIAVYQGTTGAWSVLLSSTNYTTSLTKNVGGTGYVPVQGDYDGDGKADFVVYNTSTGLWYGLKSSTNYTTTVNVSWGGTGYVPVKGDFDGDGKADLATYVASSGTFYILLSGSNYTTTLSKPLGGAGYIAVPVYP